MRASLRTASAAWRNGGSSGDEAVKTKRQPEGFIRFLALAVALAALVLGIAGWTIKLGFSLATVPEILVRTIWLYIPRPEVFSYPDGNPYLFAGAFFGAISSGVGAVVFWMAAANAKLSHVVTRTFRRGHTIVVGSSPLAERLVKALAREGADTVHVSDVALDAADKRTDDRRMVIDLKPQAMQKKAGLLRASAIVVDMGNDTDTLVTAKPILRWLEQHGPGSVRQMSVRVGDPFLADMFVEFVRDIGLGEAIEVRTFDENTVAARHALSSHPLFVRAVARGQRRVHALIVGFGDFGEKLLDQVILTSIAGELREPRVTVVDRNAARLHREFATRRPGVCESLDIAFVDMDLDATPMEGALAGTAVERLRALEDEDPFTAIYLALREPADNIRAALLLKRQYDRHGQFAAPVLYRARGTVGVEGSLLETDALPEDAVQGFIPLPSPDERLARFVLGEAEIGKLARRLHEQYLQGAEKSAVAARQWSQLPETMRRANIRAADHLKAKLWTLGIGLPFAEGLPVLAEGDRRKLEEMRADPAGHPEIARLARIEHDRWMVDRKLDGWVRGPERDDVRRIHPKLVPFDDLSMTPADIEKDVQQILAGIDHMLARAEGA